MSVLLPETLVRVIADVHGVSFEEVGAQISDVIQLQGVGHASLAPTPFIRNGSSAHSQMHALVMGQPAWYGSYNHHVPGFYIEHAY